MNKDRSRHPTNPEYWAWRTSVFERDNGLCQICGGKGHEVHHILGWTRDPDRRYDIKNGITLCMSCHEKTDNYYRPGLRRKPIKRKRKPVIHANTVSIINKANTSYIPNLAANVKLNSPKRSKLHSFFYNLFGFIFIATPWLMIAGCSMTNSKIWWINLLIFVGGILLMVLWYRLMRKYDE